MKRSLPFLTHFKLVTLASFLLLLSPLTLVQTCIGQSVKSDPKKDQKRGKYLLGRLKFHLTNAYFDKSFQGIDLDKSFKAAEEKMASVSHTGEMFLVASQMLMDLNDSHTYLLPPPRLEQPEYGFVSMMFGDKCIVTYVRPASDAESKGLKSGDEILAFGAIKPTRDNYSNLQRVLYWLTPVKKLHLSINSPDGGRKQVEIVSNTISMKDRERARKKYKNDEAEQPFTCKDLTDSLVACKLRTFDVEYEKLSGLYKAIKLKKQLILDLRGNAGGLIETETNFLEHFFDRKVFVANRITRYNTRQEFADGKKECFRGDLAILIDSETASAAEVVARVFQIENRGRIFGDISAGAVRTGISFPVRIPENPGSDIVAVMFAIMGVTIADVVMSDGSRLEGRGVNPDEPVVPSQFAIREGLDPILALAASRMGATLSPKEAASLGFLEVRTIESIEVGNTKQENRLSPR